MSMLALVRHWREGVIGALLIAAALLWVGKTMAERQNGTLKSELNTAAALIERERDAVRIRTVLAKAEDAANAARVERNQSQISQEVTNDYQTQLADLRRRHADHRLRSAKAGTNPGGGGGAGMPGISETAGSTDGAAGEGELPAGDALIASEQALQLTSLQEWLRAQEAIER